MDINRDEYKDIKECADKICNYCDFPNCDNCPMYITLNILNEKYEEENTSETPKTFSKYIESCIKNEKEFDAIIGGVEMPCTFCFGEGDVITDYCKELYGALLNSPIKIVVEEDDFNTETIEVLYDDDEVGEGFCTDAAGYCSESKWNRLFRGA